MLCSIIGRPLRRSRVTLEMAQKPFRKSSSPSNAMLAPTSTTDNLFVFFFFFVSAAGACSTTGSAAGAAIATSACSPASAQRESPDGIVFGDVQRGGEGHKAFWGKLPPVQAFLFTRRRHHPNESHLLAQKGKEKNKDV